MLKLKLQYFGHLMQELTHWKRPWCWERLTAGGDVGDRGWDGWMASPTQWTWVWVNSGRQWRTGRPDMLQSMGLQRVRHEWVAEKQQKLVPKLFGIRDQFHGRQFLTDGVGRWFGDDARALHLLCTLFLLLLYQLHLRSSGVRSWRLGTLGVDRYL